MQQNLILEPSLEELFRANKDALFDYATNQVHLYEQSAHTTCDKMDSCIKSMLNEYNQIIAYYFFLFWSERRTFYWKLYHLRFFRYQVMSLTKGELVLSLEEYAQKTRDFFSNEIYKKTLPDIHVWTYDMLDKVVGRQRELIKEFPQNAN